MTIRILISTATFTRRADDDAASILRDLLMRKRESKRMKDIKSQFHRSKERERERKRERRMTLHETVYERNETLNRTSFFVFFFRCNEEKHETHRDAFSVVVVLIISSNNSAFLSRSLRESNKSFDIFFFVLVRRCPKQKENLAQKNSAIFGHKRMDFNRRVLFLCFCATDPFPAKRKREERQNLKNLKKNKHL